MALRYHHCRLLELVRHDIVTAQPTTELTPEPDCRGLTDCPDDDWHMALHFETAYEWVAQRVGYWPLFLAVGTTDDDLRLTTYQHQFSRQRAPGPRRLVLFSWSQPPGPLTYMDYLEWHIVLNSIRPTGQRPHDHHVDLDEPDRAIEAAIFHAARTPAGWLRRARHTPVQAVAPEIDLRTAEEIWVPNQRTQRALERQGFNRDVILQRRLGQGRY